MSEITDFGWIVLAVSATVFVALLGMRLADRVSLPYAALFLVVAATLSEVVPALQDFLSTQELALMLAFFARPLAVGALLLPARLTWGERAFIAG